MLAARGDEGEAQMGEPMWPTCGAYLAHLWAQAGGFWNIWDAVGVGKLGQRGFVTINLTAARSQIGAFGRRWAIWHTLGKPRAHLLSYLAHLLSYLGHLMVPRSIGANWLWRVAQPSWILKRGG